MYFVGQRFCGSCGYALVELTTHQQLRALYALAIHTGSCPERDPAMYGTHEQQKNLLTKNRQARKIGSVSAMERTRTDLFFTMQMLENKSMPPWFVACAQIVWERTSAEEKQAAVDDMIRRRTDDPEFRLPRIINAANGEIYEVTYNPSHWRTAASGRQGPPGH